jgi:S-DNA-T family DNA segregation ATPase FtsK/SpoIIIE
MTMQQAVKRRYDLLHEVGVRDVTGYNAAFDRGELGPGGRGSQGDAVEPGSERVVERLPFVVVVVDERDDRVMVAARDVEESITRIAAMARAVGIHLVIATQRPSVNVITGVIKANVPARLAFAVASLQDSRVILDQAGAEKLLGRSPVYGTPVEMYVKNGVATVVVGDWYGTAADGTPFHGSVVRQINAQDPANMKTIGEVQVKGWARTVRGEWSLPPVESGPSSLAW